MSRRDGGFALAEVVAAAALLIVFAGAALATVQAALQAERLNAAQAARGAALRRAARQVVLDLQFARDCAGGGTRLDYFIGPGPVPDGTYEFAAGELRRSGVPVAVDLTSAAFTCLRAERRVRLELTAPPDRPGRPVRRVVTQVYMRRAP